MSQNVGSSCQVCNHHGRSEDILTHFRSQTTDTVDPQGMSLPRTLRLGEGKDCGPDAS